MSDNARNARTLWIEKAPHAMRILLAIYFVLLTFLLLTPHPGKLLGLAGSGASVPQFGVHFIAFTVLGSLAVYSRFPIRWSTVLGALLLYAIVIEAGQYFFPPRAVELKDFVENFLGLGVGFGLGSLSIVLGVRRPVEEGGA